MNWIELNWIELNWIELNWNEMKWNELNWYELNWIEMNWVDCEGEQWEGVYLQAGWREGEGGGDPRLLGYYYCTVSSDTGTRIQIQIQ